MQKLFKLIALLCLATVFAATAATEQYTLYLNTDAVNSGQCAAVGGLSGVDAKIDISVNDSPKAITAVTLSLCNGSAFAAPSPLNLSDWSLTPGAGVGGSDIIEGKIPLTQLGNPAAVAIIAASSVNGVAVDIAGNGWAGFTLNAPQGNAAQPIPALSPLALGLLLVVLFALSWFTYRRRYARYHWLLLLVCLPALLTVAWALSWTTVVADAQESGNGGDIREIKLAADGSALYIQLATYIGASTLPPSISKLNDSGIIWGGEYPSGSNADCSGVEIAAQDCSHGRDAQALAGTLVKIGGGEAGFDFTKLNSRGDELPASATNHACVRDNVTGLVWEVKTDDNGLHDKDNTYSWYNIDSSNNGGDAGAQNGGICSGSHCDTAAFVAAVNSVRLCGQNDWRLPTREELRSIVNYSVTNPTIDISYFPNTRGKGDWQAYGYWSSSSLASNSGDAWGVYFYNGNDGNFYKAFSYSVRLVRGL